MTAVSWEAIEAVFGEPLSVVVSAEAFDPDQPRDEHGRWTSGGGGGGASGDDHEKWMEIGADGQPVWKQSDFEHAGYELPDTSSHPVVKDNGDWGSSHHESSQITGAAATLMGIKGYDDPANREPPPSYYSARDLAALATYQDRQRGIAEKFLTAIASDRKGAEEPLYHGWENRENVPFHVGDTLRLPLTATAGDITDARGYGTHLDKEYQVGTPSVFVFPKGTQMAAYSKWSKTDAKEFGSVYSEAIVAGGYTVTAVRRLPAYGYHDERPMEVVSLKQTESFDPKSKSWGPR